jgi:DNA 3'-phosphatase
MDRLVIISNQAGVDKTMDKPKAVTVRGRIDNFVRHMGVPMEALCATQKDCYRKGMGTGMWDLMASTTGQGLSVGGVAPLKEESFYVGDAAGASTARSSCCSCSSASSSHAVPAAYVCVYERRQRSAHRRV